MSTVVAFDVDGTLIDFHDNPQWHVVETLRNFKRIGCTIIVWSGGGKEYAEVWVKRLFLKDIVDHVREKPLLRQDEGPFADICFDDEFVTLATVNVKLPTKA